jgi:hypothetical protein
MNFIQISGLHQCGVEDLDPQDLEEVKITLTSDAAALENALTDIDEMIEHVNRLIKRRDGI